MKGHADTGVCLDEAMRHPCRTDNLNDVWRWDNEQQRERVRIFWKNCQADTMARMTEGNDSRKSLEHDLKRIDSYIAHLIQQFTDTPYHGIAVFSCHALDT